MGRGIVGIVAGIALTLGAQYCADKNYDLRIFGMNKRVIPDATEVQEGFVAPSEIERIASENIDTRSSEPETYMTIKGEKYALAWTNNVPQLFPYGVQVVPIQVVPTPAKQDTTKGDTTAPAVQDTIKR